MSRIKPERAYAAEHFKAFGGLGQSLLATDRNAADMQNLRIDSDGSLKKRAGYRLLYDLPDTVSAYWEGTIDLNFYQFAICRSKIYRIDPTDGSTTHVGTLRDTSNKHPEFIFFEDNLFVPDTGGLLMFNPAADKFSIPAPYVPLYGIGWNPINGGEMNEPFNLLTNCIRVQYYNVNNSLTFQLPFFANKIHGVTVNSVSIENYNFESQSDYFTIDAEYTGKIVEVGFEVMLETDPDGVTTCKKGTVYPGHHHDTLCLYDSNLKYRVYYSNHVTTGDIGSCRRFYPDSQRLYFTDSNVLFIGDPQYPVTSICHYGKRLLAYSDTSTWEILCPDDKNEYVQVSCLFPDVGCTAPRASIVGDGLPIIVNQKGIYQLKFSASGNTPPELIRLSDSIRDRLPVGFHTRCIAREDQLHNELWVRDPNDKNGRVFVYHFIKKQWYVFTNLEASLFYDGPSFRGFVYYGKLYAYDESLFTDAGDEIEAFYQSGYFDFGHPEARKRSLRMTACANLEDETVSVKLETEHASQSFWLSGSESNAPEFFDARVLLGRFRFLRFRLNLSGTKDCRIYSLSFYANL